MAAMAVLALAAVGCKHSIPKHAKNTPPPKHRVHYRSFTAARVNPLGLLHEDRFGYRRRLLEPGGPVTRETFAGLGIVSTITPAWTKLGPYLELQPLSILNLSASVEAMGFFRTFDQLQSFSNVNARFDDDTLRENGRNGRHYATTGRVTTMQGVLQFKLGPIAARETLRLLHTDITTRPGEPLYYDQIVDALMPAHGFTLTHDADLAVIPIDALTLGVRHSLVDAFYPAEAIPPGTTSIPSSPVQRVGPLISFKFFDEPGALVNAPTLTLLAQWWVQHPYRTGAYQPTALPLIALALAFTGDFWKWR